ncbi:hypothetical protein [Caproiciproducens sp. MSJ-32]|uniref:hypothetical protein n=1 Tax=Caproiciproducens sp. MSJ-32 TaxID=2841527 RepID=UPI001C0F7777|nr:hypothetical protein [Caproiciproducens sp. MSJ-32]MBU5454311.1 hypothetical protein [Caproiciproducens sp. MSJ-32]
MKIKRILLIVFSFLLINIIIIGASDNKSDRGKGLVLMGEIIEIKKNDNGEITSLTIDGYLKGKEVIKTKIVTLLNQDTKIMNSSFDKKEDISIEIGDLVSMRVDEKITKEYPLQAIAKRIFITKNK